jgi:hypothetical protein
VNDKGVVALSVAKRDLELVEGYEPVGGMMALCFDQKDKLNKFLENKRVLEQIFNQERNKLFENQQTK